MVFLITEYALSGTERRGTEIEHLAKTLSEAASIRDGRDDIDALEIVFEDLSEADKLLWDKEALFELERRSE